MINFADAEIYGKHIPDWKQNKTKPIPPPLQSQTQRRALCSNKLLVAQSWYYRAKECPAEKGQGKNPWWAIVPKASDCLRSVLRNLILHVFSKEPRTSAQVPACHLGIWGSLLRNFIVKVIVWTYGYTLRKYKIKIQDEHKWENLKQQAFKCRGILNVFLQWFHSIRTDLI